MGRLRRFPDNRYVGIRDTMQVYDCDDDRQLSALEIRSEDAGTQNIFQTFGPDTLVEARSRGFHSVLGGRRHMVQGRNR